MKRFRSFSSPLFALWLKSLSNINFEREWTSQKFCNFFFMLIIFFFEGNLQQIISSCWRGNELVFFSVWIITWGAFFALSVYYFYEHHRDDHKRYICWNLLSKVIICWELLFLTSSIRIAKWLRNYYFSGNFFFSLVHSRLSREGFLH